MKTKKEMDRFLAQSKKDFDKAVKVFDNTMVNCNKLVKKIGKLQKQNKG